MPRWLNQLRDQASGAGPDAAAGPESAAAAPGDPQLPPADPGAGGAGADTGARPRGKPAAASAGPRRTARPERPVDAATLAPGDRKAESPSIADRLGFWNERPAAEDDEDREIIRQIRLQVYERTQGMEDAERERFAASLAREMAAKVPGKARQDRIVADVLATLNGRLGPIDPLLRDPEVTEILVNAPHEVWVEKQGHLEPTRVRFRGDQEVRNLVESIAIDVGRKFDWASPILDARLPDGSRVNAVRWPVALRGTAVSIRRFPHAFTFDELVGAGALPGRDRRVAPSFLDEDPFPGDVDVADFLRWAARRRLNMVIAGSTSAGKSTALNAIMELLDPSLRVVIIEDSAELQPPQGLHVVRFERRPPNVQGQGEIDLVQILRAALRQRPDIIVVGECRTTETAVMIEAMTTGHPGSLTTVHAESPADALVRMTRMIRPDFPDTPSVELREYIASAVQVVLQFRREAGSKGGRRIIERVSAVEGLDRDGYFVVRDLYRWQGGCFRPTGHVPSWARPEHAASASPE
jgi:pilus assembly protein CpaF